MRVTASKITGTRRLAAATLALAVLMPPAMASPTSAAVVPKLAFATDTQVRVVDADGRNERVVAWRDPGVAPVTGSWLSDPAWSPDGTKVAFANTVSALWSPVKAELRIASAQGGPHDVIVEIPAAGYIENVRWSPTGNQLAFVLWTPNPPLIVATWTTLGSRWDVYVVNVDGSGLRPVAPVHASMATSFDFSPDGRQLAVVSDQEGVPGIFTLPVDDVGVPTRVSPVGVVAGYPRWSPDGSRIAFTGTTAPDGLVTSPWLWTVNRDGTDARQLPAQTYEAPAWSPDGRTLAFTCTEGCGLGSIGVDGTGARALTPALGQDHSPAWSRRGQIAFARDEGERCCSRNLWVMDGDGSNPRRVSAAGSVNYAIAWSS